MKVLLTGHEGYLSCQLAPYLSSQGWSIVGVGRADGIEAITRARLEAEQIEMVVNCATAANRVDCRPVLGSRDEAVNVFGVRRLVEAMTGTGIPLIHFSTKDVYGNVYSPGQVQEAGQRLEPLLCVGEETPLRPQTIYAKSKLMGEFLVESYDKATILRLSSGYTSHLHPRGNWILNFCRRAKAGAAVQINGSGKQLRDPLHVDDIGSVLMAIQSRAAWGYTFNVGGGMSQAHSIIEVLDLIDPSIKKDLGPGDDLGYVTDNSLVHRVTGWAPQRDFKIEIKRLMERVRNET